MSRRRADTLTDRKTLQELIGALRDLAPIDALLVEDDGNWYHVSFKENGAIKVDYHPASESEYGGWHEPEQMQNISTERLITLMANAADIRVEDPAARFRPLSALQERRLRPFSARLTSGQQKAPAWNLSQSRGRENVAPSAGPKWGQVSASATPARSPQMAPEWPTPQSMSTRTPRARTASPKPTPRSRDGIPWGEPVESASYKDRSVGGVEVAPAWPTPAQVSALEESISELEEPATDSQFKQRLQRLLRQSEKLIEDIPPEERVQRDLAQIQEETQRMLDQTQ